MKQYLDMLNHVMLNGSIRHNRTGIDTIGVFGYQMRFDLSRGFPLLTTKKIHFKSVVHELLWFLSGETNIAYLKENGVSIWDEWANAEGELGPVYGKQWRSWETPSGYVIDQMGRLMDNLKSDPLSRRHIITAWNPADVGKVKLPPCHCMFQFYVHDNYLSCHLYQRSADAFLGVPFNIASYALLTNMIAQCVGLFPGEFIHSFGDLHIYINHLPQVNEQIKRKSKSLPIVSLNPGIKSLFKYTYEDIYLVDYHPHPALPASVAV